jgi:hypothetical protein
VVALQIPITLLKGASRQVLILCNSISFVTFSESSISSVEKCVSACVSPKLFLNAHVNSHVKSRVFLFESTATVIDVPTRSCKLLCSKSNLLKVLHIPACVTDCEYIVKGTELKAGADR